MNQKPQVYNTIWPDYSYTNVNDNIMTKHPVKYNNNQHPNDTWKHNWEVMKPFVHFGFKAMTLIGGALIGIIKLLPGLLKDHQNPPQKENRIMKI